MHNVEWEVEDTKLTVTIELVAITRDGHNRFPTDSRRLAQIDPQAFVMPQPARDSHPPVGGRLGRQIASVACLTLHSLIGFHIGPCTVQRI